MREVLIFNAEFRHKTYFWLLHLKIDWCECTSKSCDPFCDQSGIFRGNAENADMMRRHCVLSSDETLLLLSIPPHSKSPAPFRDSLFFPQTFNKRRPFVRMAAITGVSNPELAPPREPPDVVWSLTSPRLHQPVGSPRLSVFPLSLTFWLSAASSYQSPAEMG